MDETIYVIFQVQFDFALEVWFSINNLKSGFPRSGKSQGKMKQFQGQGKVREF